MRLPENGCIPGQPSVSAPDRRKAIMGMVASIAFALTHTSSGEDRPRPIDAEQHLLEHFGFDADFHRLLEQSACTLQCYHVCRDLEKVRMTPGERFEALQDKHIRHSVPFLLQTLSVDELKNYQNRRRDADACLTYLDSMPHIIGSVTCDHGKIDVLLRLVHSRREAVVVDGNDDVTERRNLHMRYHTTSFGVELLDKHAKRLCVTTANPNGIATLDVSRYSDAHPFSIRFCPASDVRPAKPETPSSFDPHFSFEELNS